MRVRFPLGSQMNDNREDAVMDFRSEDKLKADFDVVASLAIFWYGTANNLATASELLRDGIPSMKGVAKLPSEGYFKNSALSRVVLMLRGMQLECLFKGLLTKEGKIKGRGGTLHLPRKYGGHNLFSMARDIEGLELSKNEASLLKTLGVYIEIGRLPFRKRPIDKEKPVSVWVYPGDEDLWHSIIKKVFDLIHRTSHSQHSPENQPTIKLPN